MKRRSNAGPARGDANVQIAGLLLDMAALQGTKPSALGYKRAAYIVFSLDRPVAEYVTAGTLRAIRGIGPSSERVIAEFLAGGASPTVEQAVRQAAASRQADVEKRRAVRDGFLSWSGVLAALNAKSAAAVVSAGAYRGDFQMHTTWSDGSEGLEGMAADCRRRGWTRMCVTDHSYGLPVARGMSMEQARAQHRAIDALNERLEGGFTILKGIEANILADGRVDMTPEELDEFELVIASPHSLLRRPEDQTARMIAAVETPGVHMLGHPRGRVFNARAGIVADWDRVFAAAARRDVAIELDGTWDRQDIDADLARRALDAGCLFAIDSDAHAPRELDYVDYGLAQARLARVPADRVINCWEDGRLRAWMKERRRSRAPSPAARVTEAGGPPSPG